MAALTDLIWEKCFLRVRVCNLPRNALTLRSMNTDLRILMRNLSRGGPRGEKCTRARAVRAQMRNYKCAAGLGLATP